MEKGMLDDAPKMSTPVDDVWHNVEIRDPGKWKVHLEDGSVVSPIDIQRYYLGKIEGILDGDGDKRAFRLFEEVLDGLESKSSKDLARRIEWLDRWYAIQDATADDAGPDVEMSACKQYSEIGEERSLFYKRQRRGLIDRVTTDDRILNAIQEPPTDTRAALRRNLCDRFNIEAIDWSLLVVNDGTRRRIDLYDPYATKLEERYATAG
jgi:proteasome accessory factor A